MKSVAFYRPILNNPLLTDNGLLAYIALRLTMRNSGPAMEIRPVYLYYLLCDDVKAYFEIPDSIKEALSDGLQNLLDLGYLGKPAVCSKNCLLFDPEALSTNGVKDFFLVKSKDINTIMRTHSPSVLVFYVRLVSQFWYDRKHQICIGLNRSESIINATKVHKNSYYKYLKLLQDLNLIYINRKPYYYKINDDVVSVPRTIGHYTDKDTIDKIANEYAKNNPHVVSKRKGKEK